MARTKVTVRRIPVIVPGNKKISFKRRRIPPFKIIKDTARNENSFG